MINEAQAITQHASSHNGGAVVTTPAIFPHDDIEAIIEAIATRVVAKLIGNAEPTSSNGLRPYDALKYQAAIREGRAGNYKPLQEYLKHYMPKPL